jgi:hypothetical protein
MYINRQSNYIPKGTIKSQSIEEDTHRKSRFKDFFENEEEWETDKLRELCWGGCPKRYRAKSWKVLFEYIPGLPYHEETALKSQRVQYKGFMDGLWGPTPEGPSKIDDQVLLDENYTITKDQILKDIKRTFAETELFTNCKVQNIMIRL